MPNLQNKTVFITGASRGIGKAIGLRAALDGANVVVTGKTDQPHPKLPGTIHTAVEELRQAGGHPLAVGMDIRFDDQLQAAVERAVTTFGGIDILVNNASAISLTGTADTPMRRYDLMFAVNVRGTYAASRACLPHLQRASNPHILNLAPPLNLDPKWFKDHVAYTMAKYGMSMCVLGMAEEFRPHGIGVNALWPATVIHTAAVAMLQGRVDPARCRTADIVADAAHAILVRDSRICTGRFFVDEDVLREEGVADFSRYAVDPAQTPMPDLFLG